MEWTDQFQQILSRPVLAFVREYWIFLLVALTLAAWWILGGTETRSATSGTDLTIGDGDGGDGGGDGGGGD